VLLTKFSLIAAAISAAVLSVSARAQSAQSIPFQLEDNLVHIDATLDGKPTSAVLDSGTGAILVNRDSAARLGLKEGAAIGVAPGGGTHPEALYPTVIDRLTVGPVSLAATPAVIMNTHSLSASAGFPIDVLVGTPVFLQGPVRIDYPARRVTFYAPENAPACTDPIPLAIKNGVPLAMVTLKPAQSAAPVTLYLYVDLGTRHIAAMIGGKFLRTSDGQALWAHGAPQQIGTGTGGAVAGIAVKADELTLGNRVYPALPIALTKDVPAFNTGDVDGTLGVPLWKEGAITFDYANHHLCLTPTAHVDDGAKGPAR
jgi:hypothetical protein